MYFLKYKIFKVLLKILKKDWKNNFLDFSQLGEERLLLNIIDRISKIHKITKNYVDIGGFDPVIYSNTFKLYQLGWHGLIIEPNQKKTKYWKHLRPKDTIINAAIVANSYTKRTVKLYKSSDKDPCEGVKKKNSKFYFSKVIKINEVFDVLKKNSINPFFLNLDIEGNEEKIIFNILDNSFEIPLLCFEIFPKDTKNFSVFDYRKLYCVKYLQKKNYILVGVHGISLIFCHKKLWVPFFR